MGRGWLISGWVILTVLLPVPASLAETINLTLLQLNDVYEITPVEGGSRGGLARVAMVRQQLLRQNPRTYTILAGDAFSPSALGTAQVNRQPLAGRQMVDVMNTVGFNYATFGNHEFDLPEEQFRQRLQESRFTWFSSNVLDAKTGRAFAGVPESVIFQVKGAQGNVIRVGLIGLTLASNPSPYVRYLDPIATAKAQAQALKGRVDILIAVTHLALNQDQQLIAAVPEINLVLGGHEHENIQQWRGRNFTPVFKADANARSVYIHDLAFDTVTRRLQINSRLQPITDAIPDDRPTAKVVQGWVDLGFQAFRAKGFQPEQVIATTPIPLDGLEESVRDRSTALTDLVAQAMLREVEGADLAVFNSGMIRIDDIVPIGPITQYDVIRILPFGGKVLAAEIRGDVLQRVLQQGQVNRGTGGYLQTANVQWDGDRKLWLIRGQPLQGNQTYRVAINDFLLSGREMGLDFLTPQLPGVRLLGEKRDVRVAVIDQLRSQKSETPARKPLSLLVPGL